MSPRAVVTGANGFLGIHLVHALVGSGFEVTALVHSERGREFLPDEVSTACVDLRSPATLEAVAGAFDGLFHLAAYYGSGETEEDRRLLEETNVEGTRHVLDWACERGIQRVIHTSTIGTIGRREDGGLPDESTPFNLPSPSHYVRSKWEAECLALDRARSGALNLVVVNPTMPIGAYDRGPTVTGARIVQYLQGEMPHLLPGGMNCIDARDVARGHFLAAQKGESGQRYILGGENLTPRRFLEMLQAASGQAPPREERFWKATAQKAARWLQQAGAGGSSKAPPALVCSNEKMRRQLALEPRPLQEAFSEAVRWFRSHGYVQPQGG